MIEFHMLENPIIKYPNDLESYHRISSDLKSYDRESYYKKSQDKISCQMRI